jgi:hypothetical protein
MDVLCESRAGVCEGSSAIQRQHLHTCVHEYEDRVRFRGSTYTCYFREKDVQYCARRPSRKINTWKDFVSHALSIRHH